ncbi:glycerol-3-phosphate dehydrogenase/oxidase [Rhodopseudomonas sp.]|uniref:glycerol-3-phosphate dehydrogenase/oxidase n=1 Tax=Rhodopseudomonas sp. TaxID=1078 RepID=UPI003B3A206E
MQTRDVALGRATSNQTPEVLIIGGGINGIGTFRDLAQQGVAALLVERGDFCSGTSAAPSRLIHGGLRYLETGELSLVRESLIERNRLLLNAPHVVKPLRIWVPVRSWFGGAIGAVGRALRLKRNPGTKGALVVKIGLLLYDILGRTFETMPRHRFIGARERTTTLPGLAREVHTVAEYYDAKVTMPERLGLELIDDSEQDCPAALALPYVEVTGTANGAVQLRDVIGGRTFEVRPRVVVNCSGAWLDRVDARLAIDAKLIGGTKGSHLVLRNPELARQLGDIMLYYETPDFRICLVYALDDRHVLLGTTDIQTDQPDDPVCTQAEVDYLYRTLEDVLPGVHVSDDQIVFAYAGVRPLPLTEGAVAGAISRDHELREFEPSPQRPFPVLSLVGGKWTTYRACAEQIADAALERLGKTRRADTANVAIGGGDGWPASEADRQRRMQETARATGLSEDRIAGLFDRYGVNASAYLASLGSGGETMLQSLAHYAKQEIAFIATHERVTRLDDVLLRRTPIALLGDASPPVIEEIAGVVAGALGWSEARNAQEITTTKQILAQRHTVKRT